MFEYMDEDEDRCGQCHGRQLYVMIPCLHPVCAYCTESVISPRRDGKKRVVLCPPVSRLRRSILGQIQLHCPELPLSDGISIRPTEMIRLRGISHETTREDVKKFLCGFKIAEGGVNFTCSADGKSSGDVFVEFVSLGDSTSALERDGLLLSSRPITVRRASMKDLDRLLFMKSLDTKIPGYPIHPEFLRCIEDLCLKPRKRQQVRGFEVLITLLKRIPWSKSSLAFVENLCQVTLSAARALRKRVIIGMASPELFKTFVDVSLNSQGFLNSHLARLYISFFSDTLLNSSSRIPRYISNLERDEAHQLLLRNETVNWLRSETVRKPGEPSQTIDSTSRQMMVEQCSHETIPLSSLIAPLAPRYPRTW